MSCVAVSHVEPVITNTLWFLSIVIWDIPYNTQPLTSNALPFSQSQVTCTLDYYHINQLVYIPGCGYSLGVYTVCTSVLWLVCILRLLLDYGVTLWVGDVLWFTVKAICELFGSKLQC